jgi:hypothetical protein
MNRFVSIPREALADLLKSAGSPLTPEAYLASLPEFGEFRKYASRTSAAVWSKNILLAAAIISALWTCLPIGFSFEGVLVTVILAAITYFEFQVHRAFRDRQREAPVLGFRNQVFFAAFIFLYGLYHAFAPLQVPANYREIMGDADTMRLIRFVTIATYLTVGIVGGISQFCLAWYYSAARVK